MKKTLLSAAAVLTMAFTTQAQAPIYSFPFDNSYAAAVGTKTFIANDSSSFTTDRQGNANGAVHIKNLGLEAADLSSPNLPNSNNPRSISMWVKLNRFHDNTQELNFLFSYGGLIAGGSNIGLITPTEVWYSGFSDELTCTAANSINTWYHYVFTYNGTTAKIYRNGTLVCSGNKSWDTEPTSNFLLGSGPTLSESWFDGAIDDLQIYNSALSDAAVSELYVQQQVGIDDIPATITTVYPNPTNSTLNIEVKENMNVKIVNMLGATVATERLSAGINSIDVSMLAHGVYFVQSSAGNSGALKFIKQ